MPLTSTFVETQFPSDISYGSSGGAGFSTTIFTSSSGREQRNINWSVSRAQYDISQGIKTVDQMSEIIAFFMAMMGRAYAFRYKDWADFQIVNQQIAVGDGTTTVFQLVKTYTAGSRTFTRTIKKPVNGTLGTVTVNGTPTSCSIDTTTGLITFGSAPANTDPIVVTYCEFDVPVRFDTDLASVRQDFFQVESWESIKLVEVKL
jgi:uncharacterized protein (TIGR02217 family)